MSADLTCPTCKGEWEATTPRGFPCPDCDDGRRRPELHEWDALKAERDRLLSWQAEAVEALRIGLDHAIGMDKWRMDAAQGLLARAALDYGRDLAERTRRIRADE